MVSSVCMLLNSIFREPRKYIPIIIVLIVLAVLAIYQGITALQKIMPLTCEAQIAAYLENKSKNRILNEPIFSALKNCPEDVIKRYQ